MAHAAQRYAVILERTARDALAQLGGLPDAVLNQPAPIPEANTLYALATHLAGAGEFWAVTLPDNRPVERDRESEFRASGTLADLIVRYERWLADLHAVLDPLPDDALDRVVTVPFPPGWLPASDQLTVRYCLLHAVAHSAVHLGHIQLTTQLFRGGFWSTSPGQ